jgi:hypothetical protein
MRERMPIVKRRLDSTRLVSSLSIDRPESTMGHIPVAVSGLWSRDATLAVPESLDLGIPSKLYYRAGDEEREDG